MTRLGLPSVEREANGIPIGMKELAQLESVAKELGIEPLQAVD